MFRWPFSRRKPEEFGGRTAGGWSYQYRSSFQTTDTISVSEVTSALIDTFCKESEDRGDAGLPPQFDDPGVLSAIMTTDRREGIQCLAAIRAGLTKDNACENALLALLHDPSETVRRTAALALYDLGTVRGLSAVVAGRRHGHAIRTWTAFRLREYGPIAHESVPALVQLLHDSEINYGSREMALTALVAIGSAALPVLEHALRHGPKHLRYYAARVLRTMNQTPELKAAIDSELAEEDRNASIPE